MRNTIAGLMLALLFVAGLFALPRFFPHKELQIDPAQAVAGIEPGFRGTRPIGPWILNCGAAQKKAVPMPFSLGPHKPVAADAQDLGRCRAFVAFRPRGDAKKLALLVSFRVMGQAQHLAMFVRMPPTAKKGEMIAIRIGQKGLKLPVSACGKGGCLAGGSLAPKQEVLLYSQPGAELLLPAGPGGKRPALHLPLQGLRMAIGAMRRAEAGD